MRIQDHLTLNSAFDKSFSAEFGAAPGWHAQSPSEDQTSGHRIIEKYSMLSFFESQDRVPEKRSFGDAGKELRQQRLTRHAAVSYEFSLNHCPGTPISALLTGTRNFYWRIKPPATGS
jgi:hypothetical protein